MGVTTTTTNVQYHGMHHRQCARRPRARVCVYVPFRWLSIRDGIHGGVDDGSRHVGVGRIFLWGETRTRCWACYFIFMRPPLCYTNKKEFGTLDFFFTSGRCIFWNIGNATNRDTWNAAYTRCAPVTWDDVVRPQKRAERERRDQLRAPGPQVPELSSNTSTWKFETMS